MHDFFKPWRRKFGVVVLVMACVFAAGWIRSRRTVDCLEIESPFSDCVVISGDERLQIVEGRINDWVSNPIWVKLAMTSKRSSDHEGIRMNRKSFDASFVYLNRDPRAIAPYWSLVVPLTLLSACLLLSKPRQKKPVPAKPSEST
jgi:hypothetical protein